MSLRLDAEREAALQLAAQQQAVQQQAAAAPANFPEPIQTDAAR
jgi:hypothetical protein